MIKSLTEEQYSVFMTMLDKAHIRDQCILLFLLHGGLRNGEACNLNFSNVCIGNDVFHTISIINGHSIRKQSRYVTLSPKLINTLSKYISWFRDKYSVTDLTGKLFLTQNRKIRIQQRDVQRIVAQYTKQYLSVSFTPHSLRHTFATRLLKCSNIRIVQQLLGHDSLTSTQIYTHPSSDDRNIAIQKAF